MPSCANTSGIEDRRRLSQTLREQRDLLQRKAKYGGLDVSEARRLKVLTDENAKLKKLLAEAMLDSKHPVKAA